MRHLPLAVVTSLLLFAAACTGSDDDDSPEGTGGVDAGSGGGSGTGGRAGTGGKGGSQVEFTDLPGKIRFVNLVSDGTSGVSLDLYWGVSLARSEPPRTLEYGEITEFITPRRLEDFILDPDEARFFLVPEGDVSGTPASFLVQDDPTFTEDTVLTIALTAADNFSGDALVVSRQNIDEGELSTPPAGMAHVFGATLAFSQIEDGDFVLVGTDDLCSPDRGDPGGANLGVPAVIPEGPTVLSLYDANTEPPCATSAEPVMANLEEGHTYVLFGEAETYEIDARKTVLLEVGTED